MSNQWDEDDDQEFGNSGSALRKQLEKALAGQKKAEEELAKVRKEQAETRASQILADKGYPAKVAKFATAEGIDVNDAAALDKWLEDNSDILPKPSSNQHQNDESAETDAEENSADEGLEDAFSAIQRIHSKAQPGLASKFDAAVAKLPKDASPQEVLEAFKGL